MAYEREMLCADVPVGTKVSGARTEAVAIAIRMLRSIVVSLRFNE
jgi:hypothetical protein